MRVVHVLRKPCSEGTVAANVLRHGTGAIHIDATRIPSPEYQGIRVTQGVGNPAVTLIHRTESTRFVPSPHGRWPANMVLDADAALPELAESTRYFLRVGS